MVFANNNGFFLRLVSRSKLVYLTAVAGLALAVGSTVAIFATVDAVLLRPLPFPESEELVVVKGSRHDIGNVALSYPDFLDIQTRSTTLESLGAFRYESFNLLGNDFPESVWGTMVSSELFGLLGVGAELGRVLVDRDDQVAATPVVVLSHGLWQRRFGADPGIVGSVLLVDGRAFTVVGVMPRRFQAPLLEDSEVFVPLGLWGSEDILRDRGNRPSLYAIGRMQPGVEVAEVRREVSMIADELAAEYPGTNEGHNLEVTPALDQIVGNYRTALLVLLAAGGLVLLVGAVNVAHLMLSQSVNRRQEMAVRAALGAGRGHFLHLFLTESLWLSLASGGLGLLLAHWIIQAFRPLVPYDMLPRMMAAHIDARAIGFASGVSLLVAGLYSTIPLLSCLRNDLAGALHDTSPAVTLSPRARTLQRGLVVLEIGLALLLLVSASLLLLSFRRLADENLGFVPEGLITAHIQLNRDRYAEPPAQMQFFRTVLDRIDDMSGSGEVALVQPPPLSGSRWTVGFVIDGRPVPAPDEQRQTNIARVSEQYFTTAGIRLLRGRTFTAEDTGSRPQVALIDRAFASAYWPGHDPIGSRIKLSYDPGSSRPWLEVVGVVDNVSIQGAREDAGIQLYVPFWQSPVDRGTLISRPQGQSSALTQNLRSLVAQIDPDQPIASVSTMEENLVDTMLPHRLASYLLTAFAFVALALAATGIYGVISHSVAQRRAELSLRMILGATPELIRRQVAGEVGLLAAIGIGLGLIMVPIVSPVVSHFLFRMSPWEPAVLAGTSVLTIGVSLLAGLLASHKVTRVEPITALRYQ